MNYLLTYIIPAAVPILIAIVILEIVLSRKTKANKALYDKSLKQGELVSDRQSQSLELLKSSNLLQQEIVETLKRIEQNLKK